MAKTASDTMIETLIEWDVDTIFGIPGDGINGIMEALRVHTDKVRFIQVRHEEAAAFAACSYAKFSGRLGVCLATSGPGAIHLLNGLYDAKMDGAPVLALTGQQYSDLLGLSYQQEVDLLSLYKDVAAFNQQVQGTSDVRNLVNIACRTALGKRTVAHITFPIDYQVKEASNGYYKHHGGPPLTPTDIEEPAHDRPGATVLGRPLRCLRTTLFEQAAQILNEGKKIAIMVGHGAISAREEVEQVAEKLGAVVVKSLLGKSVLPDDHPHSMGGLGLLGTRPGQEAMEKADTLLMIGTSFPYPEYLPKPDACKGIQIDIDETRIGLRFPVTTAIVGDAKAALQGLLPLLNQHDDHSFLEEMQESVKKWKEQIDQEGSRMDMPMKPQVVAKALEKLASPSAIFTGDSGTNTTWVSRNIRMKRDQMFSCSGNLATMAPGLPYSIGAQAAFPDRQVIAFVGDGGFTMLMGEMLTAVKYNLPIKVVIIKNNTLGQIKWEQIVFLGNPEYGVSLQPADFAGWARAAGAQGFCCEDPTKMESVMRDFLAVDGPAVLEAVVDPNEPPMPPKIEAGQAIKFAQALMKGEPGGGRIALTLFRDKVDELIGSK